MHVLGTCGHVDHGKSSLLRLLTDMEPDRLPEEKKRGMTIDLGFVWMAIDGDTRVGIVDVPGHRRFVKNMISGAINIDAFIFVVAADDGWMPQSQEHLEILRSLGVRDGIAVVTKVDLVDKARADEVEEDVAKRLTAAFGKKYRTLRFSTENPALLAPVRQAVAGLIATLPAPRRDGEARLWIDRVFLPRGLGIVATGTLREGVLREGDEVTLWPSGKFAQVKSMQSYHRAIREAQPVSRVALGLTKVQREDVDRGMLLTRGQPGALTKVVDVKARFFHKVPVKNVQIAFHIGTRREKALLILLAKLEDKEAFVRLKFSRALPLREGDRFVLRTAGEDETIGAGTIVDPQVTVSSHKQAQEALSVWSPQAAGAVAFEAKQRFFVEPAALEGRSQHGKAALERELKGWPEVQPGVFVNQEAWEKERPAVLAAVAAVHAKKQDAIVVKDLRASKLNNAWLARFLEVLAERGELRKQGDGYLPVAAAADPAQRAREQKARDWLAKSGGEPAPFKDASGEVKKLARELVRAGEWVALGEEYFWDAKAYGEIRARVEAFLGEKGQATTSELKGMLGLSRKIAVMLFEQLDRDRVTYLKDGVRKLLKG